MIVIDAQLSDTIKTTKHSFGVHTSNNASRNKLLNETVELECKTKYRVDSFHREVYTSMAKLTISRYFPVECNGSCRMCAEPHNFHLAHPNIMQDIQHQYNISQLSVEEGTSNGYVSAGIIYTCIQTI